jgi:hypothetical protein
MLIAFRVLPTVKRNVHKIPMAIAFLLHIFDAGLNGKVEQNVAHTVFQDVISDKSNPP